MPNGVTRVARYVGDQGCVTLPEGETTLHFTPTKIEASFPIRHAPWPMGDTLPSDRCPRSWTRPS